MGELDQAGHGRNVFDSSDLTLYHNLSILMNIHEFLCLPIFVKSLMITAFPTK
jgi:hypothetical protein